MNTPAAKIPPLPVLLLLLLWAGCSWDDRAEPSPSPVCPISFVRGPSFFLNVSYGADGHVDTLRESGNISQLRVYAYRDRLLVVRRLPSFTTSTALYGIDSVWTNEQGLVLRHLYHSVTLPETDSETFFTYNGAGELQQRLRVKAAGHDSLRTQYRWLDGDPVATTVNGNLYSNEFAGQYQATAGDYLHLGDLISFGGYRTVRSRHLATQFGGKNLRYEFSGGGAIRLLTVNNDEYSYEYRCE